MAGADHVALGSDFDGAVTVPFDATGLPQVTQALLDAGLPEDVIARVMGGNVQRVLRASLP
jgi:microsomal dipeptidase-like Zn-dependent dipeptidase